MCGQGWQSYGTLVGVIEVQALSKTYGSVRAVDELTFDVQPGVVTCFLGPNGAGKSTTMRMIVGLDNPSAGTATINGKPYRRLEQPLREVGALLDASALHPRRSARSHLRWIAAAGGISRSRVDEVLGLVGLEDVASKRVGGFSLGMRQRLGLAAALLGDPAALVLDEPVNGLDPEGIRWVRLLLRRLASEGRAVLVSSHLLSEMAQTAERLVVIGRGALIADTTTAEFVSAHSEAKVVVRSAAMELLDAALTTAGISVTATTDAQGRPVLVADNTTTDEVGMVAYDNAIPLTELAVQQASLEDVFMQTTGHAVEYHATGEEESAK